MRIYNYLYAIFIVNRLVCRIMELRYYCLLEYELVRRVHREIVEPLCVPPDDFTPNDVLFDNIKYFNRDKGFEQ